MPTVKSALAEVMLAVDRYAEEYCAELAGHGNRFPDRYRDNLESAVERYGRVAANARIAGLYRSVQHSDASNLPLYFVNVGEAALLAARSEDL
jgi:hypothetical protein